MKNERPSQIDSKSVLSKFGCSLFTGRGVDPITNESKNADFKGLSEDFKANHLYVETKSRRLQLLLQPSLYEKIKAKADEESVSVNALVHSLLKEALEEAITSPNNP